MVILAVSFYWKNLRGIWPVLQPVASRSPGVSVSATPIVSGQKPVANSTGMPLKLPDGFSVSIFAENLPNARVMAFDSLGNMWISQPDKGTVSMLEIENGKVVRQNAIFRNLKNPHGLAFDPDQPTMLYIAEENKISRVLTYSDGGLGKIADLPSGGGHFTRTLGFGPSYAKASEGKPDGRLYVSIGSSCNVCNEKDDRRAKIFSMEPDGSDFKEYARGLRNSVFFTWRPDTKQMWATEMGRDLLGDNLPPDEINIISEGQYYGWPICYGKNIHDTNFDKSLYFRNPCMEPFEKESYIDIPAHSAPLGLAFIPTPSAGGWPSEYRDDLLVAYHGSLNRSTPTGYKIVRMKLDKNGNYQGTEDFISGWIGGGKVYGRPVDLVFGPNGNLYVSDDKVGLIYKITPNN